MIALPLVHHRTLRRLRVVTIVLRAALGLFLHGLARPFAPAVIERRSGRVHAR